MMYLGWSALYLFQDQPRNWSFLVMILCCRQNLDVVLIDMLHSKLKKEEEGKRVIWLGSWSWKPELLHCTLVAFCTTGLFGSRIILSPSKGIWASQSTNSNTAMMRNTWLEELRLKSICNQLCLHFRTGYLWVEINTSRHPTLFF